MEHPSPQKEETPVERFKRLTTRIVSVPRAEVQKRELKWKNDRKKHETHKRHRWVVPMAEDKFPRLTGTKREQFIFSSADAFKRASLLALQSVKHAKGGEKFHLGIVYGVNGAFAVELYLKCLLEIESGQIPATHNLKDLFYQLSRDSRGKLKKDHNKRIQDNFMLLSFRKRLGIKTDLHSLLEDGQDIFKQFRYIFEGVPARTKPLGFALEPFGELVRNRILDLRPEWLADESTSQAR